METGSSNSLRICELQNYDILYMDVSLQFAYITLYTYICRYHIVYCICVFVNSGKLCAKKEFSSCKDFQVAKIAKRIFGGGRVLYCGLAPIIVRPVAKETKIQIMCIEYKYTNTNWQIQILMLNMMLMKVDAA